MISKNVSEEEDLKDTIFYRLNCGCGSDEHKVTLELSHDEKFCDISMKIYFDATIKGQYNYYNWFEKQIFKIKSIFRILFDLKVSYHEEILFSDKEHLESFKQAIDEATDRLNATIKDYGEDKKLARVLHESIIPIIKDVDNIYREEKGIQGKLKAIEETIGYYKKAAGVTSKEKEIEGDNNE